MIMRLKYRVKFFFVILLVLLSFIIYFIFTRSCSHSENKKRIEELCELYHTGTVSGDLCEPLCTDYVIRPINCLGNKEGKRVIKAMWENTEIILKAHTFNITVYRKEWATGYESSSLDAFRKSILVTLRSMHGIEVPAADQEHILDHLWSSRFNWKEAKKDGLDTAMRSLWSLVIQDEYARMQYYQGYSHVPAIRGTCGYLYAVTSVPHSPVFDMNPLHSYTNSWSDRVQVALSFLDLVEDLDTQFPEPMHICDVQPSNFGFVTETIEPSLTSRQSLVSLIDMDMVFSETFIKSLEVQDCSQDSECDFFDCKMKCVKGKCVGARSNNNLQSICEDIFSTHILKGNPGLLINPPEAIKPQLEATLHSCVEPDNGSLHASKETLQAIREVLKNSYNV